MKKQLLQSFVGFFLLLSVSVVAQLGTTCANPIVINGLPFQDINNTANFSDTFDISLGSCPPGFHQGNDAFYSFTANENGNVNVTMIPIGTTSTNSSVGVYDGCATVGYCPVTYVTGPYTNIRNFNFAAETGHTYIFLVSSSSATQTVGYNLLIEPEDDCLPRPTGVSVANITTTGADISWDSNSETNGWEVALQPLGDMIPSGAGVAVATNSYSPILAPATRYQFWIRGMCNAAPGQFTGWSGPFPLDTNVCEADQTCNYTFRLSSTSSNGWGISRVQVRQNGIVVATIGETVTTSGPTDVNIPLCKDFPFDLYWNGSGNLSSAIGVQILNSFGQVLYMKPTGSSVTTRVLYSNALVSCQGPDCSVPPLSPVVSNITVGSATFTWQPNYPGSTQFEILTIPGPNPPAQIPGTDVPASYPVITVAEGGAFTFTATDLEPATIYYSYIRSLCAGGVVSDWKPFNVFNTVTCPDSDKCNYKLLLTSTGNNDWGGGQMKVRQNGIIVATLSANVNDPDGTTVALCDGVPFDVYWNVQGSSPHNVGLNIRNAYQDLLYTMVPGTGMPETVVFSSIANCTTPTCPKPINLSVSGVTTTTAVLSWTETGTANQWEIYVAPTGSPFPVNGSAINGTGFYHVVSTNSYTITNLSPQTEYTYYVRSLCSGNNPGNWTIVNAKSFATFVTNDECANAIVIPVTAMGSDSFVAGSTRTATASPSQPGSACNGANDDVWFSFVAASDKQLLKFDFGEYAQGIRYMIYAGNCNNSIGTCDVRTKLLTGLTVGLTYKIRVYSTATASTIYSTFNVSVSTPDLVTNDECSNAIPIPVNPSLGVAQFISSSTLGATASSPATECVGADDDVWFSFTAISNVQFVNLTQTGGDSEEVSFALYDGTCDTLLQLYCSAEGSITASGLIIGNNYKIRVFTTDTLPLYRYANFDLSVTTPPALVNDEPEGAIALPVYDVVCDGAVFATVIGATASPQATCPGFDMYDDDDIWFVFTATTTAIQISMEQAGIPLGYNFAFFTGSPDNLVPSYCNLFTPQPGVYRNFVVGQQYYLRFYTNAVTPQLGAFSICLKTIPTCETAALFCASASGNPYIFPNVTGLPDTSQLACLGNIPNPVFYNLRIAESGPITMSLLQNTAFDNAGNAIGDNLDADFVTWGPFTDTSSCDEIVYEYCDDCPNNTNDYLFYPFGNIVDCSFSGLAAETLHFPNAQAGEYYLVMITNFNGEKGFIKLTQTNFGIPGAGSTVCEDRIRLMAFIDENGNGIKEENEANFPEGTFIYQKNDEGPLHNITTTDGIYDMYGLDPSDSYDFSFQVLSEYSNNYSTGAAIINNISIIPGGQVLYFPVTISQGFDDVSVTIVPLNNLVSGSNFANKIIYKNEGTNTVSGTLTFQKDSAFAITTISQSGIISNVNGFTYDFANLAPFQIRTVTINMLVPPIPTVNLGDMLANSAAIVISGNDIFPANNNAVLTQPVLGSYDPNDKTESHGSEISVDELDEGSYLFYTVRFQNTGTYNASNIRLIDLLDPMLDEASIRMVSASHIYTMERIGSQLAWTFDHINLPAEMQDEANSHGYVTFKIKPKPGYVVGDIISNNAEIYFDSNPAIVTNTVQTEVSTPLGTTVFDVSNVALYPNPANTLVHINLQRTTENLEQVTLYDVLGKAVKQVKANNPRQTSVDVSGLAKGVYMVEIKTENNLRLIKKLVIN